jgi:hypothetical protein
VTDTEIDDALVHVLEAGRILHAKNQRADIIFYKMRSGHDYQYMEMMHELRFSIHSITRVVESIDRLQGEIRYKNRKVARS